MQYSSQKLSFRLNTSGVRQRTRCRFRTGGLPSAEMLLRRLPWPLISCSRASCSSPFLPSLCSLGRLFLRLAIRPIPLDVQAGQGAFAVPPRAVTAVWLWSPSSASPKTHEETRRGRPDVRKLMGCAVTCERKWIKNFLTFSRLKLHFQHAYHSDSCSVCVSALGRKTVRIASREPVGDLAGQFSST